MSQDPPRTTRRQGAVPPRIGVLGMSDPSAHARLHILDFDRSGPPSIPAGHVNDCGSVARYPLAAAMPAVAEYETEKLPRLSARCDKSLVRVKFQPPANEKKLELRPKPQRDKRNQSQEARNKDLRRKRPSDPETKVVEPVVGGEPVAVRRAEEDRSDEPGPPRARHG
jgi:hypothetical protein